MIATLMQPAPPARAVAIQASAVMAAVAEMRPFVRAVIAGMLREHREHPDVDDCTNETVRRAIEGHSRLRDGDPVRPWVTGIAKHVALDALRRKRTAKARSVETHEEDEGTVVDRLEDKGATPFERLAHAERSAALNAALATLGEGPREALVLFHGEGLAYNEIAQRMGVPLGTVATWVTRGRKSVAAAMQNVRGDHDDA